MKPGASWATIDNTADSFSTLRFLLSLFCQTLMASLVQMEDLKLYLGVVCWCCALASPFGSHGISPRQQNLS